MAAVLVPYDGSKLSQDALEFACERFPITHQPEQYVGVKLGDIYEQREAEGEELLADAEALADEYDVQLSTAVRKGRPSKEILEYVAEHGIDHVVIGSHSQDLIERFFVGSVAERVVDRIPVPVTVIR